MFNIGDLKVIGLGIGTVFAGLIIIILLCKLMSLFSGVSDTKQSSTSATPVSQPVPQATNVIPDKPALIAAISAVVAEELGTDITNIRIHSIKRV